MNDLVDTTEMYLRTILELEEEGVPPLRARIAERLHQSGPTVSQTVARMERDGLLTVEGDRHLHLTDLGRGHAVSVMRKHRLAELLLVNVIGMPYEEAHAALTSFHGIGPQLADCIALFALHHTCAVPVDTHLWHAATRLYFPEWEKASITDLKYKTVSAHVRSRFGDLTGWAHQHLFFDSVLNWRSRLK